MLPNSFDAVPDPAAGRRRRVAPLATVTDWPASAPTGAKKVPVPLSDVVLVAIRTVAWSPMRRPAEANVASPPRVNAGAEVSDGTVSSRASWLPPDVTDMGTTDVASGPVTVPLLHANVPSVGVVAA